MPLQVWLPLCGNTNNQGLSAISFSNVSSNTAINSLGKIGECYVNNSFSSGGLISTSQIDLGSNQSMFCWVKFTSLNSNSSLGAGLVSQHRYATKSGMGLTIKYVSSTTGYLSVNTGNGSTITYNEYCATTLMTAGTWYHVGYTYDGNNIRLYVDGVLEKTQAYSGMYVPSDYLTVFCWSMNTATGTEIHPNYRLNGYLNDIRIYNHCLSAKEVKEISKGLMCHYRLSGCGGENYMKNNSYNPAITICGWGNSTYSKSQVDINDGFVSGTFTKITRGNSGRGDTRLGWTVNDINIPHELYNDKKITVSCWVKSTTGTVIDMNIGRYSDKDIRVIIQPTTIPKDTWKLIKGSTVFSSESDYASTDRLELYIHCDLNTDYIMSQIKVEISDTATPWCPNSADELYSTLGYNDTTEYDCSGYGNNGTKVGDIIWKGDSARYIGSYGISGTNSIYTSNIAFENMEHGTLSFWIKFNNSFNNWSHYVFFANAFNWTGSGADFIIIANRGQLSSTANASSTNINIDCCSYKKSVTVTTDKWYHIVITWDAKNYVIKKYFNSGLIQTVDDSTNKRLDTYRSSHNSHFIGNGSAGTLYSGDFNISDLRIFSTVLDDSDIKSLYNVAASADKSGVFSAYEFVEG